MHVYTGKWAETFLISFALKCEFLSFIFAERRNLSQSDGWVWRVPGQIWSDFLQHSLPGRLSYVAS